MILKSNRANKVIFLFFLIFIILFYAWSNLLGITLILILITDIFTTKVSTRFLKGKLSKKTFYILKYGFYILLPITLAVFVRTFFFDIYFVPSSSMEQTLFPNDYVIVNKVAYGTKIPNRLEDIPVIGGFFKKKEDIFFYDLYRPLRKFKDFNREDIVVFKSVTDNNKFLIKRIIGMPGDTLKIKDSKVLINNTFLKEQANYCYNYIDSTQSRLPLAINYSNKEYDTLSQAKRKSLNKNIATKTSRSFKIFPYSKQQEWTRDNYGPIVVPKKGMTITLSKNNFDIYKNIIAYYENERVLFSENKIQYYTFKNDYYFMMGDNRHSSLDSRVFGFVPESYIQGKMIYVFSKKRMID